MVFHIITIFPEIFQPYIQKGIIGRAQKKEVIQIKIYNLRDYATDKHKKVDDTPYGGGPGMVLKIQPIYDCIIDIKRDIVKMRENGIENSQFPIPNFQKNPKLPACAEALARRQIPNTKTILFSAKGGEYNQRKAFDYSKLDHLILICGRYEGVDERVAQHIADEEISIGNYILTGGEIPAMAVVDSVTRLVPEALGNPQSLECETYDMQNSGSKEQKTDYPVYTKPEKFKKWKVPEVLLGGNHSEIAKWREGKRNK